MELSVHILIALFYLPYILWVISQKRPKTFSEFLEALTLSIGLQILVLLILYILIFNGIDSIFNSSKELAELIELLIISGTIFYGPIIIILHFIKFVIYTIQNN